MGSKGKTIHRPRQTPASELHIEIINVTANDCNTHSVTQIEIQPTSTIPIGIVVGDTLPVASIVTSQQYEYQTQTMPGSLFVPGSSMLSSSTPRIFPRSKSTDPVTTKTGKTSHDLHEQSSAKETFEFEDLFVNDTEVSGSASVIETFMASFHLQEQQSLDSDSMQPASLPVVGDYGRHTSVRSFLHQQTSLGTTPTNLQRYISYDSGFLSSPSQSLTDYETLGMEFISQEGPSMNNLIGSSLDSDFSSSENSNHTVSSESLDAFEDGEDEEIDEHNSSLGELSASYFQNKMASASATTSSSTSKSKSSTSKNKHKQHASTCPDREETLQRTISYPFLLASVLAVLADTSVLDPGSLGKTVTFSEKDFKLKRLRADHVEKFLHEHDEYSYRHRHCPFMKASIKCCLSKHKFFLKEQHLYSLDLRRLYSDVERSVRIKNESAWLNWNTDYTLSGPFYDRTPGRQINLTLCKDEEGNHSVRVEVDTCTTTPPLFTPLVPRTEGLRPILPKPAPNSKVSTPRNQGTSARKTKTRASSSNITLGGFNLTDYPTMLPSVSTPRNLETSTPKTNTRTRASSTVNSSSSFTSYGGLTNNNQSPITNAQYLLVMPASTPNRTHAPTLAPKPALAPYPTTPLAPNPSPGAQVPLTSFLTPYPSHALAPISTSGSVVLPNAFPPNRKRRACGGNKTRPPSKRATFGTPDILKSACDTIDLQQWAELNSFDPMVGRSNYSQPSFPGTSHSQSQSLCNNVGAPFTGCAAVATTSFSTPTKSNVWKKGRETEQRTARQASRLYLGTVQSNVMEEEMDPEQFTEPVTNIVLNNCTSTPTKGRFGRPMKSPPLTPIRRQNREDGENSDPAEDEENSEPTEDVLSSEPVFHRQVIEDGFTLMHPPAPEKHYGNVSSFHGNDAGPNVDDLSFLSESNFQTCFKSCASEY